jgi:transcriptional regulator with XRE-family HTH domain
VQPQDAPIAIGRELPAHIRIADPRVSRTHMHIEVTELGWTLTDARSTNGTYLDGQPIDRVSITDGLTVHLGDPQGIPVTFTLTPASARASARAESVLRVLDAGGADNTDCSTTDEVFFEEVDAGIAAAGAAVVRRREELGFTQRKLMDDGVIGQSNLVAFERGRRWPRENTRAKLEKALGWGPGHLARLRHAAIDRPEKTTDAMSATVRVSVLVQALELALSGIKARIETLPHPDADSFTDRAGVLLEELGRVHTTATQTVRTAKGSAMAVLLGDVRRTHNKLVVRAARAPGSPLSQRLYAARHLAELTVQETAAAAGVDAGFVADAEAGQQIPEAISESLQALVEQLLDP